MADRLAGRPADRLAGRLAGRLARRETRRTSLALGAALGVLCFAWVTDAAPVPSKRTSPHGVGAIGESGRSVRPDALLQAETQPPAPVVDHRSVEEFLALSGDEIAAAASLRMLFIDHSVGQNINEALDCTASPSLEAAPSRCKRFEHVVPAFSADPRHFRFGRQYDRSRWTYHYGASSYWREWPAEIDALLAASDEWDVVIPMPSYLVAPNGGWQPITELESRHPGITFVYATSSLPRGAEGGTERDLVMQQFNAEARAYALAHAKPLLDVADLLSHDYDGRPCHDSRDGVEYCQTADRCENLPDDGYDIPAICPHYTTELYGGHLGNVSGGGLRMSQAVWLLMTRLAGYRGGPLPTASPPATSAPPTASPPVTSSPPPATSAPPTASPPVTSSPPPTASPPASSPPPTGAPPEPSPTAGPQWRLNLPLLER